MTEVVLPFFHLCGDPMDFPESITQLHSSPSKPSHEWIDVAILRQSTPHFSFALGISIRSYSQRQFD